MALPKSLLLLLALLAGWEGAAFQLPHIFQRRHAPPSSSPPLSSSAASSTDIQGLSGTWDREAWIKGFETARTEECYELEGAGIPRDLDGTLFRNGHAKFDVDGVKIAHPFDGDGMITAITFKDGRAFFRNRFVRTKGYADELRAKKILYRGTFGTQKEGGWLANILDLRRKNVANTNVVFWGQRLLALWEGGLPHLMDPITLQTFGESRLARALKPGQALCAHPRFDPLTNRYVFFSADPDPRSTRLTVYEFNDKFELVKEHVESLPGFSLMHDMVITKDYYVFFQAPVSLVNPLKWVLGLAGVASCIQFEDSRPAKAYLIPRNDAGRPRTDIDVDPHFSFHFANAYDDEATGEVVVDIIRVPKLYLTDTKGRTGNPIWETVNYETEVPLSNLWRYRLNPSTRSYTAQETFPTYCDFPSIPAAMTGKKYRYAYLAAGRDPTYPTPVGVVAKFDVEKGELVESWQAEPHEFISESVVVPKEGGTEEDDCYLLTMVFDGHASTSQLLIFDAKSVKKGPISRLQIKSNIPLSLHGTWASDAKYEGEDIMRKYKVYTGLSKFKEIDSAMQSIF